MYCNDKPIKNSEEDLLKRSSFSKDLAAALINLESSEGFCVGLHGPWGSGKTSIINMTTEEIQKMTKEMNEKPIIISFNPWNFSSKEQLLSQFFVILADKFYGAGREELRIIGESIKNYAKMLTLFGDAGKLLGLLGNVFGTVMEQASGEETERNIQAQKDKIVKALSEQKVKTIVIIDDIDRLTNEEIRIIFQLICSVANFPNTTYLLSFDKDVVVNALKNVQNIDGEKYLEKIVQLPIAVPEISKRLLIDLLLERLNKINDNQENVIYDAQMWRELLFEYVNKYIKTIRDVNRLGNALTLKCSRIGNDYNYVDMIAITIVETKLPELYIWIKENKDLLVQTEQNNRTFFGKKEKEIAQIYDERVRMFAGIHSEEYISLLKFLFPFFSARIKGHKYTENNNMRRMMRIAHQEYFDRYFTLELDENSINRTEFNYVINSYAKEDVISYIQKQNKNDNIIEFLNEIESMASKIPEDRMKVLIHSLVETVYDYKGVSHHGLLEFNAFDKTLYTVRDLFMVLRNSNDREELLINMINNSDAKSLQFIVYFVNVIELAHGRLAANGQENGGEKVFDINTVQKVEILLLEKIKELSNKISLFRLEHARMILYMYECLDSNSYEGYLKEQLQCDFNKLIYMGFFVNKWRSGTVISWESSKGFEKFISEEDFRIAFDSCLKDGTLWNLDRDSLHKAIAFYFEEELCYEGMRKVYDSEVERKIKEIKR